MGEMTMAEIREVLNAHEEWEASDSLRALVEGLEAKLAAAEAKVAQCREVLREREFPYWNEHTGLHYCSSCYAQKGIFSREPHIQECAWKRAMEDA